MLKNETETLKEEISKLKHGMSEKEILIKTKEKSKRRKGQTDVANKNPTNAKKSISTKCTIKNDKQICSTSKNSR